MGASRGSDAIARGELTRGLLRSGRYRRAFPDVYVEAGGGSDLRVRSQAAYLLVAPRAGVLADYSAAELLGASRAPRNAPAEVFVDHDAARIPARAGRPAPGAPPDEFDVRARIPRSPNRHVELARSAAA